MIHLVLEHCTQAPVLLLLQIIHTRLKRFLSMLSRPVMMGPLFINEHSRMQYTQVKWAHTLSCAVGLLWYAVLVYSNSPAQLNESEGFITPPVRVHKGHLTQCPPYPNVMQRSHNHSSQRSSRFSRP